MHCNECLKDLTGLTEGVDFTMDVEDINATCVECAESALVYHSAMSGLDCEGSSPLGAGMFLRD